MRVLAVLLLTLAACCGQSNEAQVEAVLQKLERAEQTGDFNTWVGLWAREKSGELENMRPYARPRPEVRYRAMKGFVRGEQAVLLTQGGPSNAFVTFMLRREDGQWKIQDELFRNTAQDPNSVYALLPPEPGAFARAGSPWGQVASAINPSQGTPLGWQIKAVFDEAYLYIRIESKAVLPAPGSTVERSPSVWPVLKINASDAGEFVMYDAVNIGDQATFGADGKANSHRPYAAYMIRLERNDHEIFSASADLNPSPLLQVAGRDYDIRLPLAAMGIMNSTTTKITIRDASNNVAAAIPVQRYPR